MGRRICPLSWNDTTTLLVMVDRMKGGVRALPTFTRLGYFYQHDGMYARKWPLQLCVYSVVATVVV